MTMRIKNWNKFQHHKDRRPLWIKLYREEILDRRDINLLPDRSFRIFILLLLLASEDEEMNGNLPSIEDIVFRTRFDKDKILKALDDLDIFLVQDDTNLIPGCDQDDLLEKRREETEKRREDNKFTPPTIEEVRSHIKEKGWDIDAEKWYYFYDAKGWMVGSNKMKQWKSCVATWQNSNKSSNPKDPNYVNPDNQKYLDLYK